MYNCIIPAGGKSSRFGENKLLWNINNVPVIIRTIKIFEEDQNCKNIIVGCSNEEVIKIIKDYFTYSQKIIITKSGNTRSETIFNCIRKAKYCINTIVHDGCRPFLTTDIIKKVIKGLLSYDAVVPGIKIINTIKQVNNSNGVINTLDRNKIYSIQTPQGFKTEILEEAYYKYINDSFAKEVFDDSQLIEMYIPNNYIKVISGERNNIKITFIEDVK